MSDAIDNFDWVTARAECNAKTVFNQLMQEIDEDVKRLETAARIRVNIFQPDFGYADRRIVSRSGSDSIAFERDNSRILIERLCQKDKTATNIMTLTVTIDSDGDCVMVDDDGAVFKSWQVRMRALDDMFFPK